MTFKTPKKLGYSRLNNKDNKILFYFNSHFQTIVCKEMAKDGKFVRKTREYKKLRILFSYVKKCGEWPYLFVTIVANALHKRYKSSYKRHKTWKYFSNFLLDLSLHFWKLLTM